MKKMRFLQALIFIVVMFAGAYGLVWLERSQIMAKFDPRFAMAAFTNPSPASPGYMMMNVNIPSTHTSGGVVGTKTNVVRFKMPWPATLVGVSGIYRSGTGTGGGGITIDVTEAGSSMLSTPLVINSTTAAEAVLTDTSIADEALIGINQASTGQSGNYIIYNPTVQLIFKRK